MASSGEGDAAGTLPAGFERVLIPPESSQSKVSSLPAFVYGRGLGHRKAVLVLPDWWGVTPALQKQAVEWFASDFLVLVLDLYRGNVATSVAEAGHLMHNLDFTQALRDIRAAAKWCRDKELQAQSAKVGVMGASMSGALAFAAAVHLDQEVQAAVVLYGLPDTRFAAASALRIPVQLHFGSNDVLPNFSDPKAQDALEAALKEANVQNVDLYRYPGCGHAFAAPTGHTDAVERAAAGKVKERALQFFVAKLV